MFEDFEKNVLISTACSMISYLYITSVYENLLTISQNPLI